MPDRKLPGVDITVGKVTLSSGPIWTVFATYANEDDAQYAAEVLRERTLPRRDT